MNIGNIYTKSFPIEGIVKIKTYRNHLGDLSTNRISIK